MRAKKHIATVMAATMVAGSVVAVNAETVDKALIGKNRIETAVKISKDGWKSAETVILVNDGAIADALTATPLAYAKNAPILLTSKTKLSAETKEEIKRLGAKNVILIGGTAVLPKSIEEELTKLGLKPDRVEGKTREETALAIAKRLDGISDVSEIAVVNGTTGLADAVSVAAAAAERHMPILLANPKKGLSVSEKFIKDEGIVKSFIIGGTTVLPDKLVSSAPSRQRLSGNNRNDTNAKVIEAFYKGKTLENIYLAKDGMGAEGQLIDALAVGVLAAKNGSPVLIASKKLSEKQKDIINTKEVNNIVQVGGNGNEGAFNQLKDIEEVDVYEVGTVEELKEALEKANANDKIVLKPNATITEDIIISTDKNVDIKVEGTVTGKVDIDAPNGSVVDNSTSKPSTGGGGGSIVNPPVDNTPTDCAVLNGEKLTVAAAINKAESGETVKIYGNNTVDSNIEVNKDITIEGYKGATLKPSDKFTGSGNYKDNLLTVISGGVEISGITIDGAKGNGLVVHKVDGEDVNLTNITVTNSTKGGIIINGSKVTAKDIKTSGNDWYGINVDKKGKEGTKLTLSGSNTKLDEPIQIFAEKTDEKLVEWNDAGSIKEYLEIAEPDSNHNEAYEKGYIYSNREEDIFTLGAVAEGKYYKNIHRAITSAKENGTVTLYGTNELTSQIAITSAKKINLEGKNNATLIAKEAFKATDKGGAAIILISDVEGVSVKNITVKEAKNANLTSETAYGNGITLYNASANFENVTSTNNAAAGIVVNGSTLTGTNINTSQNIWGGINIDRGSKIEKDKLCKVDITKATFGETPAVYSELVSDKDNDKKLSVSITSIDGTKYKFIEKENILVWYLEK